MEMKAVSETSSRSGDERNSKSVAERDANETW
jgi:hypothetical protein